MTSWKKDEDSYRLPEGMVRIGYDADTQRYHFHDVKDGSVWEGPEGSKYGKLRRISVGAEHHRMFSPDSSPVDIQKKKSWAPATPVSPVSPVSPRSPRSPRSPASPQFPASPKSPVAATHFDQILGNIHRERSVSDAGIQRDSSSGAAILGSAIKRSATVVRNSLSRTLVSTKNMDKDVVLTETDVENHAQTE